MLAVLSLVALLAAPVQASPQDFSNDLPAGMPDMSAWQRVEGAHTGIIKTPKTERVEFSLADRAIRVGICADTDIPCAVTVHCASFITLDEAKKNGDWIIRWTMTGNGKRAEGIARNTITNGESTFEYWLREGSGWARVPPQSEEFKAMNPLADFFVQFLHLVSQRQ